MKKKTGDYQRVCKYCDNIFYTHARFGRVCDNCNTSPFNKRWKRKKEKK